MLCLLLLQTGTVVNVRLIPSSFDPKADAKALRDAMEGLGEYLITTIKPSIKYHTPVYVATRATYLRLLNWPHCSFAT